MGKITTATECSRLCRNGDMVTLCEVGSDARLHSQCRTMSMYLIQCPFEWIETQPLECNSVGALQFHLQNSSAPVHFSRRSVSEPSFCSLSLKRIMVLGELMVTGNVVTAAAYYILTVQLILFVRSNKVQVVLCPSFLTRYIDQFHRPSCFLFIVHIHVRHKWKEWS